MHLVFPAQHIADVASASARTSTASRAASRVGPSEVFVTPEVDLAGAANFQPRGPFLPPKVRRYV